MYSLAILSEGSPHWKKHLLVLEHVYLSKWGNLTLVNDEIPINIIVIGPLLTFTKAMAFRWPSWAPRGEYEHFDSIRKLCGWVPQTGFPALFRELLTFR